MDNDQLLLLVGELRESLIVLNNINGLYASYSQVFTVIEKRDLRDAVLLADIH